MALRHDLNKVKHDFWSSNTCWLYEPMYLILFKGDKTKEDGPTKKKMKEDGFMSSKTNP
jgi:hypothetical protein